ncbi:antibiotic biosynthesis monooxygenase [bacterium]|nr:antibiotic biosynthesis monooxygenase [bacterium]
MTVLTGTAEFATKAGRDACLTTSGRCQKPARASEPGSLAYYFCPDPVVGTRMVVWELWADEASVAAHFAHPNYMNMGQHFTKFDFRQGNFKEYRVDKVSAVYDETFTPQADFS